MFMFFDPLYFLFIIPGVLLSLWAQWRVHSAFSRAKEMQTGMTGAQAASSLLHNSGIRNVEIEPANGFLSDHYSPSEKVVRLSPDVYNGRSLAAFGVAAHEVGHAFQDAERYPLLVVRNALVPAAAFGGQISMWVILGGLILSSFQPYLGNMVLYAGIALFALTVLFQVINLPVEFDASARARRHLLDTGMVTIEQDKEIGRVLNAAAMTYVAATLTSILVLLYFLFRAFAGSDR